MTQFFLILAMKSTLILGFAWVASVAMRGRPAAARHLVWLAAAAAVIALPLLSIWAPALRVSTPAAIAATFQVSAADRAASGDGGAAVAVKPVAHSTAPARVGWSAALAMVWAIGTLVSLAQMLAGYIAIWRMRRAARRLPGEEVELRESQPGSMPMAAGIWKPAVFLPRDAAEWSEERRRAVLLHEMAHIRRGDVGAQAIARLALALYWWNPMEWVAWREFIKERERAADDLVLASGVAASDYARHLLEIARAMHSGMHGAAFTGAAVAMARRSQLEGRLMAILDSERRRGAVRRATMWITAACAIAAIAPLAAVRAQDTPAIPADVEATIRAAMSAHDAGTLSKIALAAEDQQKLDVALKLLNAAAQIIGEDAGTSSEAYGVALLKLADLEMRQHGLVASSAQYSQAAELLANEPEGAKALIRLGEIAMVQKDLDGAATDFERAKTADPAQAAMATMWLADVRARQKNFDEADALYKSAIALAKPNSLDAAVALSTYANFLKKQGRDEDAADYDKQAAQAYASTTRPRRITPASNGPFRIGDGVTAPHVVSKVEPEYSEEARLTGLHGTVVLTVVIGEDGIAHDIEVVRSLGMELDDKAVAAVSQWKFAPGTKNGEPVPVIATIEVNFRLL